MKVAVILPAAGLGTRMGRVPPKRPAPAASSSCCWRLAHSAAHGAEVRRLAARVGEIVVAVRPRTSSGWREMLAAEVPSKPRARGGRRRTAGRNRWRTRWRRSVRDTELVAVHDAVRPFIDLETIRQRSSTRPPKPARPSWALRAGGYGEAGETRHQSRARSAPLCRARNWCWRRRRRCSASTC